MLIFHRRTPQAFESNRSRASCALDFPETFPRSIFGAVTWKIPSKSCIFIAMIPYRNQDTRSFRHWQMFRYIEALNFRTQGNTRYRVSHPSQTLFNPKSHPRVLIPRPNLHCYYRRANTAMQCKRTIATTCLQWCVWVHGATGTPTW